MISPKGINVRTINHSRQSVNIKMHKQLSRRHKVQKKTIEVVSAAAIFILLAVIVFSGKTTPIEPETPVLTPVESSTPTLVKEVPVTPTTAPTPTEVVEVTEFIVPTISESVTEEPSILIDDSDESLDLLAENQEDFENNRIINPYLTTTPEPTKEANHETYKENTDRTYPLYEVCESYGTYILDAIYQDYTYDMCVKYGIEEYYSLMIALMWHESNFNINEISKTNDYGLCQINKCNHSWLKKTLDIDPDFLNPYTSIECGTYMLSTYLHKYPDIHTALVAYNKGENAVSVNKTSKTDYSRVVVNIMENKLKEIAADQPAENEE